MTMAFMRNFSIGLFFTFTFCCGAFDANIYCPDDGCRDRSIGLKCQSCNKGCYGQNCQIPCSSGCDVDGCNRATGDCFKCQPGLYGPGCNKRCPGDCSGNSILEHVYCNRLTGLCQETCDSGKTGVQCQEDCPATCKKSVCTKEKGHCVHGCKVGWSGSYCNISCENCYHGKCTGNGYCLDHCKNGFYGERCEKTCPHCYTTGCDRHSGVCEQCKPGYHGKHCNHECPSKCYKGKDGHKHCNRDNGHCLEGCESGYHGPQCKSHCNKHCKGNECYSDDGACTSPCEKGRYGSHCNSTCENCKFGCNRHTGVCIDCVKGSGQCVMCPDGFHGDTCTKKCHVNCKHNICHINGTCKGCNATFHGHFCDMTCKPNCLMCNQFSGECVSCEQSYNLDNGDCKLKPQQQKAVQDQGPGDANSDGQGNRSPSSFLSASSSVTVYILACATLNTWFARSNLYC